MPAQPSSQQQSPDNSLAMLWGLGLTFAVIWLLWYAFHDHIARFILAVRLYEARLIAWFIPNARTLVAQLQAITPSAFDFKQVSLSSRIVGYYLRYPIALIFIGFAISIYFGRAGLRFKRTYSMDMLVNSEKNDWPQILPVVALDLVNTDINTGSWAMALSPIQFAKHHRLMRLERSAPTVATAVTEAGSHFIAHLQREAARRVFVMQLGHYWQGVEYLPLHIRALFALFAAKIARDREASTRLLLQISSSANITQSTQKSFAANQLNFSGVEQLLKKHLDHKLVQLITQKHAYVLTVMASMLRLARQEGVVASSEFLWLKPTDRPLWFMLNSVGRQTACSEVAGPFAHWLAEIGTGQRLLVPMVESAVDALEGALREVRLSDEDD